MTCNVFGGTLSLTQSINLSTWQMIAASCPTALGALCGQLMFQLAWCHKHSAVVVVVVEDTVHKLQGEKLN